MDRKLLNPIVILKIIVSFGLLGLLLASVNINQVWEQLQSLSFSFVAFALLYYTGCQWLSCLRWQIILQSIGYSVPMIALLSGYFGGMFLNTFLPGTLGGDVYRVYRIARKSRESELAVVSVFLERVTGLFAILGLAFLSLPPAFRLVGSWDIILLLVICTSVLLGVVLLIVSPKLLTWIVPLLTKLHLENFAARLAKIQIFLRKFAKHRKALAITMMLSLFLQLLIVFYYYLIAQQLKISVSYLQLLVFSAIVVTISLLPISLGGLGVKEGLLAYLFARIDLTVEQALLLSITVTALGWLLSLPGGLVLLSDTASFQEVVNRCRRSQ